MHSYFISLILFLGSGKSTLANKIRQKYVDANKRGVICSADDYFYDSRGNYMWDPNRLTEAHEFCKQKSERHMNMVNTGISKTFQYYQYILGV